MVMKSFVSASVPAGDTIANTTAKTAFSFGLNMPPTSSAQTVTGASELRYGQSFDVDIAGVISTTASPGNLTIAIDHRNGSAGATLTALGTTGAITPPASLANAMWNLRGRVVYAVTGQDVGVATFVGYFEITKSDGSVVRFPMIATGSGTTGMTTGLDTSRNVYNGIGPSAQWSVANAGNTISIAAVSMIARRT